MAAPAPQTNPVGPDTQIIVKVLLDGNNRRFKLPLRELGAQIFPQKLRQILSIPSDADVTFERYSDSAGAYIVLDSENPAVYKQLYRAAKAKLRLRIKATTAPIVPESSSESTVTPPTDQETPQPQQAPPRYNYLDTVLSSPLSTGPAPSTTLSPQPFANGVVNLDTKPPHPLGESLFSHSPPQSPAPAQPQYRVFTLGQDNLSHPTIVSSHEAAGGAFCIDCNQCGQSIPNEHYHCSICDDGDYDLCQDCVSRGALCHNEGHWLIKRIVQDGVVTNSTTETIAPRKETAEKEQTEPELKPFPAPASQREPQAEKPRVDERTCNACFQELDETKLVTCKDCADYDLCITCLVKDEHGHHPGHEFSLILDRKFCLKNLVMAHCRPGRHHRHAAICDGCDKSVVGVRHKCLTCPDWDYCNECIKNVPSIHPGHRFVPIYDSISEPMVHHETHFGIFCDGPLCKKNAKYISGVRYKCAVCNDTDFCANCEANPVNTHNRTHPLIKFKTPVRHVSVSTFGEKGSGERLAAMGDQPRTRSTSTETMPNANSTNAATQVQNEAKPAVAPKPVQPKPFATTVERFMRDQKLQAHFIRDTIADGSVFPTDQVVTQTWTMYNPGPEPWPKGSSVRFVGGDAMLNVDFKHPSSVHNIAAATGSNELTATLPPKASADFQVTLKTPNRAGKAISYWRLKTPEGAAFGHKLWCDVEVQDRPQTPAQTPGSPQLPTTAAKSDTESATTEVEKKSEEVTKEGEVESELTESAMIFPKLEKESPVSSTHEAASSPGVAVNNDEHSILEDVESLTLEDEETDDGFLTDEEYDILDASDQDPTQM